MPRPTGARPPHIRLLPPLLAGLAALIAIIIFSRGGDDGSSFNRPRPTPSEQVAAPPPSAPIDAPTADEPAGPSIIAEGDPPPTPPPTLRLTATLLPSGGAVPFAAQAVVGIASTDPEDLAEYEEWKRSGSEGAGPASVEELANIRELVKAPVVLRDSGGGTLGPVEVPWAEEYRIFAWEEDGRYFLKHFRPDGVPADGLIDAGTISVTLPTGMALRFVNVPEGESHLLARIVRDPIPATAEEASRLLHFLGEANPPLLEAYQDGTPLIVSTDDVTEVIPMIPDNSVRLHLSLVTGQEGEPLEIPLQHGRIVPAVVDFNKVFPEGVAGTFDLLGSVVLEGTDVVPEQATVRLLGTPATQEQPLDRQGQFTFFSLPRNAIARFEVTVPRDAGARPIAPETSVFEVDPVLYPDSTLSIEETFELSAYKWLVVEISDEVSALFAERAQFPYPVFVLQRIDPDSAGTMDVPADEFLWERGRGQMAISVTTPGIYAVSAAVSPTESLITPPADLEGEELEVVVALATSGANEARHLTLRLLDDRTGQPLAGASVHVIGDHGSAPPLSGSADARGEFDAGFVNSSRVVVYVAHDGAEGEQIIEYSDVVFPLTVLRWNLEE